MKAVKIAGLAVALMAATAAAQTTGMVNYNLTATASTNQEFAPLTIEWAMDVVVTGNNQGLAQYVADLSLVRVDQGPAQSVPVALGLADFTKSFNVAGNAPSGATVTTGYLQGGPGMGLGTAGNADTPGTLVGFGAGFTPPWTYTPKASRYTPGVGLASATGMLHADAHGKFTLNNGVIEVPTGLAAGVYRLVLTAGQTNVLNAGLNLLTNLDVGYATPADKAGDVFEFEIVPEPATLLLLAGAGLFIRRRRTA